VVESGVLVWVAVVACAFAGFPGFRRSTLIAASVVVVAWGAQRYVLGITAPAVGGHGSGYGAAFYSAPQLEERFGENPAPFMAYNVGAALGSVLASEPRYGVIETWRNARLGRVPPVLVVNIASSLLTSLLIAWYVAFRLPRRRAAWSDGDRLVVVASTLIVANAFLATSYVKDEIVSVAGLFYAVAAFAVVRSLLEQTPRWSARTVLILAILGVAAPLWAFRAAGVHYHLRQTAFETRNEWANVSATDPLTARLREEAIVRPIISPTFLPRWGERWWVE
jgi:hypothetical protein